METQSGQSIPTVQKKAADPPGILPRHTQTWFIGGISLLMVLVFAFFGGREKTRSSTDKSHSDPAQGPNQQAIDMYRRRIDELARKLAVEQAQFVQTKQALGISADTPSGAARLSYPNPQAQSYAQYPATPQKSWLETDQEKREYLSRFASNITLSYRRESKPEDGEQVVDRDPSLQPRQRSTPKRHEPQTPEGRDNENESRLDRAPGKKYRLFEGTILETVLTNRLDGAFSGPVNCMVTTNVYSHDRKKLLIPQGTRILGEVKRLETFGQQRLAVTFHRLIMPNGYSVMLDQFRGLNQIGETGLRDQVDHHYLQVFGVSVAIGMIAGLSQANTRSGLDTSSEDAYRQGVATSLSQSSLRILDRYLNVLPTFTILERHRVKVYLSNDLLLPAYEEHAVPTDL